MPTSDSRLTLRASTELTALERDVRTRVAQLSTYSNSALLWVGD